MTPLATRLSTRMHPAWIAAALTFLVLLVAAGIRATPGVLILPLADAFGWTPATISTAIAVNILLYGLTGPFAAALIQRYGLRRTVLSALSLLLVAVSLSTFMAAPWQLLATWGVLVGLGTGSTAIVLGATVVNRFFAQRRGLILGALTASTATGQLLFLPLLAGIAEHDGWRPVTLVVAVGIVLVMIPFALLMPERPSSVGARPYGAVTDEPPSAATGNPFVTAVQALASAARTRQFWVLFASFFVCGLSTNGLVGTHLIPFAHDHGLTQVRAAGLLAMMGVLDLIGTTASGWLSDRYSSRKLLFWYYGLRGLALVYLAYAGFAMPGLWIFVAFYGLDWIATVPPTVRLTNEAVGPQAAPVVFGWILTGHQLGASVAAYGAGWLRTELGTYSPAFLTAGLFCVAAAFLVLTPARSSPMTHTPASGSAPARAKR